MVGHYPRCEKSLQTHDLCADESVTSVAGSSDHTANLPFHFDPTVVAQVFSQRLGLSPTNKPTAWFTMSHQLEFPSVLPLPDDVNAPPYTAFGICGSDITSSLPPRIPLKLVLHFAPALRKWILPAPDLSDLPRTVTRQSLRTPYIGIDIQAPIDAVSLGWIITRMFHLCGRRVPKESFGLQPELATSVAIHNAWLALELPNEGLCGLHTHIYGQLIYTEPPVSICSMNMLWDAFPAGSEIIKAMGLNFIRGHVNMEYSASESLEIIAWFQSTSERYALFNSLTYAMPEVPEPEAETVAPAAEEVKPRVSGYKTIGRKKSKAANDMIFGGNVHEACDDEIMERGATRKVSHRERQERETSDVEALRRRLKRTTSNDSLRSVNTVRWNPTAPDENKQEEESTVNDNMDDKSNYSDGSISTELARTLESIRLRREARSSKHKHSSQKVQLTPENLRSRRDDDGPGPKSRRPRPRRSSSTTSTGSVHSLTIANLQKRIHVLKEKQNDLVEESRKVTAMADDGDGEDDFEEGSAFVDLEEDGI